MSAGKSLVRFFAHAAMLVGAIFVVTVLLAAMPGHNAPAIEGVGPQRVQSPATSSSTAAPAAAAMDHSQMDMSDDQENEKAAVNEMNHMQGSNPHLHMTAMRAQSAADLERVNQIVTQLRGSIEKYRDYHAALEDGYRIFLPSVPQLEYHFTSYQNGFMAAMRFDPSKPTSLLYRKTAEGGYKLVGAMYTMPKRATEEQLNDRVPLSVAMWHLHTNLCMPPANQRQNADWSKFGLHGSIASAEACNASGGAFHPTVFGWMVHVYPYESSLDKVFAMHHRD